MDIIDLVTTEPETFKAYHLVKTRKNFISNWYPILEITDFSYSGDSNLLNRLVSIPREIKYSQPLPDIPVFLPISEQYLYSYTAKKSDIFIDTQFQTKENIRINMFKNFVIFLHNKGVNFTDYDNNNNPVLGKLISRVIAWDRKKCSEWMRDQGLIYKKFHALDIDKKLDIIEYIKKEWCNIWSESLEKDLKAHFIYSGFSDRHTLFTTFQCLFDGLEQKNLPKTLFDDQLQLIMETLNEFSNYSTEVNSTMKIYNYLKMDSKVPNASKNKKIVKKI